ncbi:MAG: extracellular solute-binding protein [Acidaminobacteraceae bacterium]
MKKISILIIAMILLITGCSVTSDIGSTTVKNKDWELLTESATNSTVIMYHDIKDEEFVIWIEKSVMPSLKKDYNIELELKQKSFDEYYGELKKQYDEGNKGEFDLLLYDDSSIKALIENNLLYDKFTGKLPNVLAMQNVEAYENMYSEGLDTSYNSVMLGRKQLIMIYDEDLFSDAPKNIKDMLEITKTMEGKLSYVDPSNELGRDFINSVFFSFMDYDEVYSMDINIDDLKIKAKDAIEYFNSLKPYMAFRDGMLPKNQDEIDEMFYNTSILFAMTYESDHASTMSKKELYPFGAKSFVFDGGTTGDAFYGAIPFNSNNKSGAIIVLNEMISPEAQKYKYDPKKWGNLPAVDTTKMEVADAKIVNSITLKRSDMKQEELLSKRIPEVPKEVSDMLYKIWKEEVEVNLYSK